MILRTVPRLSRSFYDDFFGSERALTTDRFSGWKDKHGNYEIKVFIPGYGKEDVKVKVKDNIITVSIVDSYSYTYRIPKTHDPTKAKVIADKGILTVWVPKIEKEDSGEIEISVE